MLIVAITARPRTQDRHITVNNLDSANRRSALVEQGRQLASS
jgi:hypothetical protein